MKGAWSYISTLILDLRGLSNFFELKEEVQEFHQTFNIRLCHNRRVSQRGNELLFKDNSIIFIIINAIHGFDV